VSSAALGIRHGVTRPTDVIGEFLLTNVLVAAKGGND
jgi:hypothetical protein